MTLEEFHCLINKDDESLVQNFDSHMILYYTILNRFKPDNIDLQFEKTTNGIKYTIIPLVHYNPEYLMTSLNMIKQSLFGRECLVMTSLSDNGCLVIDLNYT